MADTGSLAYDSILSTTLYNYTPSLENNVFNARPLLNYFKKSAKTADGGAKLIEPIMDGTNSTAAPYAGYDIIPTTPQDGITAAEFSWAQCAVSIAISGIEKAKNRGQSQVINLMEAKTNQATEALSDLFTNMLQSLTGPAAAFAGIGGYVLDSGTVGGLDPTVHTNWKSPTVDTNAVPLTIAQMSSAWNGAAKGGSDTPDFIITTQTLWEKYESLLQPQLRYSDPGTADAGFVNLLYRGAPVTFDPAFTSPSVTGYTFDTTPMYFLNSKHLFLRKHPDAWFTTTPFQRPVNQDASYAQVICYGQLVVNSRRKLAKITAKTA